jgi:hypothetical protein
MYMQKIYPRWMDKCDYNPSIQWKVTEETPKITEVSIFLIPAIKYTLKYLTWNCKVTQKNSWQKHKTDSKRDVRAQIQHSALNC